MSGARASGGRTLPGWAGMLALVLALITVAQQAAWVDQNATRSRDDDARLYAMSLCLEQVLQGTADGGVRSCIQPTPYPPLVPLVAALHYRVLGRHTLETAVQSLWVWYVLLVLGLYLGVSREMGGLAGLAAAALGPVVANVHFLRGSFYAEIPMMALAVAAVVCLVAARGFRHPAWSLALGITLGLGLLAKWTFAFFLGPPMLLAVAMATRRAAGRGWSGGVVAAGFVAGTGAFIAWTAGSWTQAALLAGAGWTAALAALVTALVRMEPRDRKTSLWTLFGLGLCLLGVTIVAAPWYGATLPVLRKFLGANLGFHYDGDALPWTATWPYYPAVLFTRALGTPLGILLILGTIRTAFPGRPRIALWSLVAFVSGMVLLSLSPYRTSRYLAAGYGLLVPLMIPDLRPWPRIRTAFLSAMLAISLFVQVSWIPPDPARAGIPIPYWLNTPPRRELFGNVRGGIAQAWHDLTHPRWHVQVLAPAPVNDVSPNGKILQCIEAHAGAGMPFYALVWDPDGRGNADALRIDALAAGFPPSSRARTRGIPATIAEFQQQVRTLLPPATRPGSRLPRNLFVIVLSDGRGEDEIRAEARTIRLLQQAGFRPVLRDRLDNRGSHIVRVWTPVSPAPAIAPDIHRGPPPSNHHPSMPGKTLAPVPAQ